MSGPIFYADITEHINKQSYLVIAPIHYTKLPQVVLDGIISPIYEVEDLHMTGRARYTISDMIDMRYNEVGFTVIDINDIIEIKLYLDAYLKELSRYKKEPVAKEYLDKASILQKEITRAAQKVIRGRKSKTDINQPEEVLTRILEELSSIDNIVDGTHAS